MNRKFNFVHCEDIGEIWTLCYILISIYPYIFTAVELLDVELDS